MLPVRNISPAEGTFDIASFSCPAINRDTAARAELDIVRDYGIAGAAAATATCDTVDAANAAIDRVDLQPDRVLPAAHTSSPLAAMIFWET